MSKIFDLEQEILQCWRVTDDIDLVTAWFVEDPKWEGMDPALTDALMNKFFGIKELYELRFDKLFKTFEEACGDYHRMRALMEEEL
jgi:hypothetical protein